MYALSTGRRFISLILYVASCVTDFLDGYIARKYGQCSAFGSFLDPVADKLLVAAALVLLMPHVNTTLYTVSVTLILCREIFVSALREWMAERKARAAVQVGPLGKVKTALQMISTVMIIAFLPTSNSFKGLFSDNPPLFQCGLFMFYVSTFLTVLSGAQYFVAALPKLMED